MHITKTLALLSAMIASPCLAASDAGLTLHNGHSPATRTETGLGAEMHLRIKLGIKQKESKSERVTLGMAAGPRLSFNTGAGRPRQSELISLTFKPGHETRFALAGQTLVAFRQANAAEPAENGDEKSKKGPSTLGWIGIGVGALVGVAVIATAGLFATCNYSFTDNCRGPSD